jgi:hypothetical protein
MDRASAARLRWRLRGAWQWRVFAALLVLDAVLLRALPIAGERPAIAPAVLLSAFFNLVVVAVLAPLAGRLVRMRRADLPGVVASDYAGATLLVATTGVLLAIGLVHHGELRRSHAALAAGVTQMRLYVAHTAPAQYRRRIGELTSVPFGAGLYRMCVPGDDPRRWLCLFVDTTTSPPGLRRDANGAPNSTYAPQGTGG